MDEFFTDQHLETPQHQTYQPPVFEPTPPTTQPNFPQPQGGEVPSFNFSSYPPNDLQTTPAVFETGDNEFNDFEQDETSRRIREEQDRMQNLLKQKSQKQWQQKNERNLQGRKQLDEYLIKKQQEKQERAQDNLRKEQTLRKQLSSIKQVAGWHKVVSNINVRQGEHKGKQDINRMREAILRKREDDSRS